MNRMPAGRRPPAANVVTLAYLLLALPLLAHGEWSRPRVLMALLHLTAIACLLWSLRTPSSVIGHSTLHPPPSTLQDWLPLLLIPFLYGELPYLMGDGVVYRDPVVQRWEAALFGGQPARTLSGALPNVLLSEILHLGYVLYYPIVYVPPLMLYLTERREEYARTALALMLAYALCFFAFAWFPVEGPRYAWGTPAGAPGGPVRSLTLAILERGSSRGTAFPSSHAAVAVAQSVVALRHQRAVGVVVSSATVLLTIGAVYGGFHYAVDMLAGALTGMLVSLVVLRTRRARA